MIYCDVKFRVRLFLCLAALILAGATEPAIAQEFWSDNIGESSKAIDEAISRCLIYVSSNQGRAAARDSKSYRYTDGGAEALVALGELAAGVNPQNPKLAAIIKKISNQNPKKVFARAIRTTLLSRLAENPVVSNGAKKELLKKIQADVDWLAGNQLSSGGWGESAKIEPGNTNDTAEALRALQAAAGVGAKVNPNIWKKVSRFLQMSQNSDGGFGYYSQSAKPLRQRGASNGSASAGGAAALAVLLNDNKSPNSYVEKKNRRRALAWLDQNYRIEEVPAWRGDAQPLHAYLYDLACATGTPMRLGGRDVDVEISTFLLGRQRRNGAWSGRGLAEDDIVSSAWAIRSLHKIRSAKNRPRPAGKQPGGVAFAPGDPKISNSSQPKRFFVIGRVAVPGSSIDFSETASKLSEALARAISIRLQYQYFYPNDIQAKRLPRDLSMLWLTGEIPSDYETISIRRVKNFVLRGGVLLIDSTTAGQAEFDLARAKLTKIFGPDALEPILTGDPLIRGSFGPGLGSDLTSVKYNASALKLLKKDAKNPLGPPLLWAIRKRGKIVVVLSRLALAGPAQGNNSPQNPGYAALDARRIVLNVLLYANSNKWRIVSDAK